MRNRHYFGILFFNNNRNVLLDWDWNLDLVRNNLCFYHWLYFLVNKNFNLVTVHINWNFNSLFHHSLLYNFDWNLLSANLNVFHQHFFRNDHLFFNLNVDNLFDWNFNWHFNHTWSLYNLLNWRHFNRNLNSSFNNLLNYLRNLNNFLNNSRNNHNFLNNLLYRNCFWYLNNLLDNFFLNLSLRPDPFFDNRNRNSVLFLDQDRYLFLDKMRYSNWYLNLFFLSDNKRLHNLNRNMSLFLNGMNNRFLVDLFLDSDMLNKDRSIDVLIDDFLSLNYFRNYSINFDDLWFGVLFNKYLLLHNWDLRNDFFNGLFLYYFLDYSIDRNDLFFCLDYFYQFLLDLF